MTPGEIFVVVVDVTVDVDVVVFVTVDVVGTSMMVWVGKPDAVTLMIITAAVMIPAIIDNIARFFSNAILVQNS
jgi:hypothetical protein